MSNVLGGIPSEFHEYQGQVARNLLVKRYSRYAAADLPRELLSNDLVRIEIGFDPLGEDLDDIPFDPDLHDAATSRGSRRQLRKDWTAWLAAHKSAQKPARPPNPVGASLRAFSHAFGLDRVEGFVLTLALALEFCPDLANLLEIFPIRRHEDLVRLLADALDLAPHLVRAALADDATLRATRLVLLRDDPERSWALDVDDRLTRVVFEPRVAPADLLARFLPEEPTGTLDLADFAHVPDLPMIASLIRRANDRGERNIHLAFIGSVGTGKNEAARLVARLAGGRIFLAGAPDAHGGSPTARQRLVSLATAYRTLRGQRAVVVMDEFDDLFRSNAEEWEPFEPPPVGALSKLAMNRLMEEAPVVTIWICNPGPWLEPSLLRRFTAVVHFKPLGAPQLRAVWGRLAGELPATDIEGLAAAYPVSPAEIASALRAARLLGDGAIDRPALERILANATRAIPGRRPAPALRAGREYLIEAVNASEDLVALADRLAGWKSGPRSGPGLLLHGVSGSGKSEFLHYLACRMGRRVLVKKVSDIESPFLGMTERNIDEACEEAMDTDALLVFDEVDSWLRNRAGARYQWEVSIPNQFLQSLEAHRGVVGLTTNLFDELDPAVMRRMTHRIRFRPVRPEQAAKLFSAHLGRYLSDPLDDAASSELLGRLALIPGLVPGDFGAVARRFDVERGAADVEALLAALMESAAARARGGRAVGFR